MIISCFLVSLLAVLNQGETQTFQADKAQGECIAQSHFAERRTRQFHFLKSESALYELLYFRAVRLELGVSNETLNQISMIRSAVESSILTRYNEAEGQGGHQAYMAYQFEKLAREESLAKIRSLLTEKQRKRLSQLAFYGEIEQLGYDVALTEGVLSLQLGIADNQASHLRKVSRRLMAQERREIRKLEESLHSEALAVLSPQELTVADYLLGRFFNFHMGNWSNVRDRRAELSDTLQASGLKAGGLDAAVIDTASKSNLLIEWTPSFTIKSQLVHNPQIQTDLELTDSQIAEILRNEPLTLEVVDQRGKTVVANVQDRFDEILLPAQQRRLDQLVQYLQLASYGYENYLTTGKFARETTMSEERKTSLRTQIAEMEARQSKRVRELKRKTFDSVLDQLSSEQKAEAKVTLGEYFFCPSYLFAYVRDSVDYEEQE